MHPIIMCGNDSVWMIQYEVLTLFKFLCNQH
jgi:hypothetical protein